jgi:Flp pilus assembly protein TadD
MLNTPHVIDDQTRAEHLFFEGNSHKEKGAMDQAEECFREALRLVPDFAEAHTNLGLLLDQTGRRVEAEHHYLHSIESNPNYLQTYLNLGVLLTHQKRFQEAEGVYRQALELNPYSPAVWSNLGVLQACQKQEEAAEQSYRTAIGLDADYQLASFNFSYLLLRQGRFEEGWRCLEARNWYPSFEKHLACPRWHGEPLNNKSVLIGFEAGHGDMIQFCRYASLLKAQGAATIAIVCHPALKKLFATLPGVDLVFSFEEPFPTAGWDFWTPPLSIPFYCQTRLDSIPATLPYLWADQEKAKYWASRSFADRSDQNLRVGLVWKGNPLFENDSDRSLPNLELLAVLGKISGVRFFSLQKGAGEEEAANPPDGLPLMNLGPQLADFADTAAIIEHLDLVISVDTAVAHLAGAMGKTCWVLLPDYKTDWRWLSDRCDSPWYPGVMRLFRQPRMGDWSAVITEIDTALQAFIATPRR